jgi:glycosyltransferase involved in cell wall biosynthesis
LALPPLTERALAPALEDAKKVRAFLSQKTERWDVACPVFYAVGDDAGGFLGQDRVCGSFNIGVAAIECKIMSPHGRGILQGYDALIAISRWNAAYLESLATGVPVHLCHQGVDTTLFVPGPKTGLFKDRFLVFSGGKFEYRKGQDIVVAAFKRFHARHPDALLVASWQNADPVPPEPFAASRHLTDLPRVVNGSLQLAPWLYAQGLAEGSFVCLPFLSNMEMPLAMCDVALFPNRCEGGTNLVAMEAMATGLPVILAPSTGQKDLVDLLGARAFEGQTSIPSAPGIANTQDWGETDPEAVLEALEDAYRNREARRGEALAIVPQMKAWDWAVQNEKMLKIAFQES